MNKWHRWLLIGSAPSVVDMLEPVRNHIGDHTSITCNGGILLGDPDVYFLADQFGCERHAGQALEARERSGTRLVTLQRAETALAARQVADFDEFLTLGAECSQASYGPFRYSGPLCLEYACHHGATEIHIVGADGYTHEDDYFYQGKYPLTRLAPDGDVLTHRTFGVLKPAFEERARVWQHVTFFHWGQPVFHIDSPNWRHMTGVPLES